MSKYWKKHRHEHAGRSRAAKHQGELREGVIQHHGRFAFLLSEKEGEQDVFLRGHGLGLAMDGDRVEARVRREQHGRSTGEIVRVITHAHTSIIGVLKQFPKGWVIIPEKPGAPSAQVTSLAHGVIPRAGALAVLKVTCWPTETTGTAGIVTEVLGNPDDSRARITAILREHDIYPEFPADVDAQTGTLPERVLPDMWQGREELFDLPVCTIDGADAKDFDDAVSLELLKGGMVRLGVHIADVSHYVKPNSPLDKEAYRRATSVYLPDRVIPMLPPCLSENLCSLVPFKERLTVSVFMDIDGEGHVKKRRMANTVIRSARRFTYDEVQTLLDGGKVAAVPHDVYGTVMRMGELTDILYKRRVERGALDFDLPEYKVQVNERGKPVGVSLRPRLKSHRLIEEFMLLANEAIATELMAAHMPFLHRRHDEPDPEKIKALAVTLGEMGLSAGHLTGRNTHKALQDVLRQAQDHPLWDIINSLMVRSMKQAVYSPESQGHFGIAARAYAHFTSPIRRYPDLTAHRAVKALVARKKENITGAELFAAGKHCSERERSAAEAEYKAVDIMRAQLFEDRIGEVMEGVVTNVINSGCFVLCRENGAEGMLRVTDLTPGTKVKVIVDAVDVVEGKISMSLAQKPSLPAQWRVTSRRQEKRRRQEARG